MSRLFLGAIPLTCPARSASKRMNVPRMCPLVFVVPPGHPHRTRAGGRPSRSVGSTKRAAPWSAVACCRLSSRGLARAGGHEKRQWPRVFPGPPARATPVCCCERDAPHPPGETVLPGKKRARQAAHPGRGRGRRRTREEGAASGAPGKRARQAAPLHACALGMRL